MSVCTETLNRISSHSPDELWNWSGHSVEYSHERPQADGAVKSRLYAVPPGGAKMPQNEAQRFIMVDNVWQIHG